MKRLALVLLCGAVLAPACKPSEFDDVLAKAPVLSMGPPGGYRARDFGKVIRPISVTGVRQAAGIKSRFVVSGVDYPSLAVVELDGNGKASTYVASDAQLAELAGETKSALLSVAELSDPTGVATRVVLGAPGYGVPMPNVDARGRTFYLDLVDSMAGVELKVSRGPDPGVRQYFGLGMVSGQVSGTSEPDLVVASVNQAVLFQDRKETFIELDKCDLAMDSQLSSSNPKYFPRAVALGDVAVAPGNEGNEILIGVTHPGSASPGAVQILHHSDTGGVTCVGKFSIPNGSPKFGTSIAVIDYNNDTHDDVIVGAPPDKVYVFPGPIDDGVVRQPIEIGAPDGTFTDFGYRVLAGDFGNGGVQVVISAPEAAMGGQTGVGQTFLHTPGNPALVAIPQAGDAASVGLSLTALPFTNACGSSRNLLLVGSAEKLFGYFRLPNGPGDARCFK